MSDVNLKSFSPLYPMRIHQYDELLNDQNQNVMDKINSIIDYLNQVGKLTNDVVKDWNTVYQWVMNEGLTTDVSNKLEDMLAKGELTAIIDTLVSKIGDMTNLHTAAKDKLVNAINEVDDLAKQNQTDIAANTLSLAENASQINDITISVKNYKCSDGQYVQGDGIHDDTTGIQAAINSGARNIFIPKGTYLISSPLLITSGINIFGVGVGSLLKANANFNAMIQNYKNGIDTTIITQSSIKNLYLYANGKIVQQGVDFSQVSYSIIENVECDGFADTGILVNIPTANAAYDAIINCIIKNNTNDGIRIMNNANSVRIYSCTFTTNGRNAIRINDNLVISCEVIGGSVEASGQSGIYVNGRGCSIIGVHIEANSKNYTGYGIEAPTNSYVDNIVSGCFFYDNGNAASPATNHIQGCDNTLIPNHVWGLGSSSMKIMYATALIFPDGYGFYGANTTGMYASGGNVYLQGKDSNAIVQIQGKGGFAIPLKIKNGMQLTGAGAFTASSLNYYSFDNPVKITASASSSAPNGSLFVDSSDNKLKFKDSSGTINLLY